MRISRLVLLCSIAALGCSSPVWAGGKGGHSGGHHPRPVAMPPMVHGTGIARPAPVRPPQHGAGHRPHRGWAGHHRGGPIALPVYGWTGAGWQPPATLSHRVQGAPETHFSTIVVAPGADAQAGGRAVRGKHYRSVRGYYDLPRPMAKIIHIGQKTKR